MLRQLTKTVAVATRTSIRGRCCSTHFPPPFSLFFFFNEKSVDCSFSRCQKKKKNVNATRWGAWLISLSPSHSRTGNGARQQGAPYSCHHFQSLGFGFSMRLEVSWTVYVICSSSFFFLIVWCCQHSFCPMYCTALCRRRSLYLHLCVFLEHIETTSAVYGAKIVSTTTKLILSRTIVLNLIALVFLTVRNYAGSTCSLCFL